MSSGVKSIPEKHATYYETLYTKRNKKPKEKARFLLLSLNHDDRSNKQIPIRPHDFPRKKSGRTFRLQIFHHYFSIFVRDTGVVPLHRAHKRITRPFRLLMKLHNVRAFRRTTGHFTRLPYSVTRLTLASINFLSMLQSSLLDIGSIATSGNFIISTCI